MSTDSDRDPGLDAAWREHSTETPPPHVDATILAAAHREVTSASPGRERWLGPRAWRWWMPLAAAAVIAVVIVGVKPPSQTPVDDVAQPASDMPAAPAEKQIAAPAPEPKVAARPKPEPKGAATPKLEPKVAATPAPKPSVATAPGEQSAAAAREERAKSVETPRLGQSEGVKRQRPDSAAPDANGSRGRAKLDAERMQAFATPQPDRAAASIAAPAQPASPAGAAAGGSSAASAESTSSAARADRDIALSADQWVVRIRASRERGSKDEALRELARFRAAYPDADARLPADLREWAKTVR